MGTVIHKPIKNEFTSFTKSVWFLLGREGGRWTVTEIMHKVNCTWAPNAIRGHIGYMAKIGLLKRYPPPQGEGVYGATYGVTRDCKIPRNLTLAEIEELSGIRFVEENQCTRASSELAAA